MYQTDYERICEEISARLPDADRQALIAGEAFCVQDIEFNLLRFPADPGAAYLVADIGTPDDEFRCEIYQSLLTMHRLALGYPNPAVFSYEADLDRIVLQVRLELSPASGGHAASMLVESLARQVLGWREEFLNGKLLRDIADEPLEDLAACPPIHP